MKRLTAFFLILIICFTIVPPSAYAASVVRDTTAEYTLAADLKNLSLFKGVSDTDFALYRAPTRTEALVMFIRALGKENEALNGTWSDPFTDVPSWAAQYVGYAYTEGLTKGITATQFGTSSTSASMYLTFVLRSLGYNDTNGEDFFWDQPFSLAKKLNLLPDCVQIVNFARADAVTISYVSLSANIKGTSQTLSDKLISTGVFTAEAFDTYYDANAISTAATSTELSSEEIYARCSPAVFYLEEYNSKGEKSGSASGFFLDDKGTAVTNYHAIKGAYSAKITTLDTNTVYDVVGVYDYNVDEDWAILKINGSGFSSLKLGNAFDAIGGATVYALGCPLGLKDTLSEGIISNPKRLIDGYSNMFIQTSAAISAGSSGGALINKYGKVVGITTATSSVGQNINLAIPIDTIKGYTTTACTTLLALAVNSNSKLQSYASYPEIPDFGAYYGIPVLKNGSTDSGATYYYSSASIDAVSGWVAKPSYSYPKYMDILQDWGFKYISEFAVGSSYYWQFGYQSSSVSYVMIVGTTKLNYVNCVSVEIIRA